MPKQKIVPLWSFVSFVVKKVALKSIAGWGSCLCCRAFWVLTICAPGNLQWTRLHPSYPGSKKCVGHQVEPAATLKIAGAKAAEAADSVLAECTLESAAC